MCYYKKCIHCTGRQSVVINADTIQITQTLSLNLSAILQINMQFNIACVLSVMFSKVKSLCHTMLTK